MKASHTHLALIAAAALAACGGASSSSSNRYQPTYASGSQSTQHAEAHLSNGHITLEHQIQFDTNSDHIDEEASRGPLTDLIAVLRENNQIRRVRVEGHADVRGGGDTNRELSQRRAQAVADYLRGHGFENVTFEAVGYGETQRVCQEDTDACHDRNRRVEFTILDPPPPAR